MAAQLYPLLRRDNGTASNTTVNEMVNNATQSAVPQKNDSNVGGGFPSFLIAVIVVAAIAAVIFAVIIVFRRRAVKRRAFGDSGGPNFDGARQGLSSLWYRIKNPRARSTNAGFEGISAGRAAGGRNAAGRALDPDEAWDSRVGHEADGYYEDTELQGTMGYVNTGNTEYTGARGGMPSANPFGDEHAAAAGRKSEDNPFGDDSAAPPALRSMSPRPHVETGGGHVGGSLTPAQTSPTRKSIFKEET